MIDLFVVAKVSCGSTGEYNRGVESYVVSGLWNRGSGF